MADNDGFQTVSLKKRNKKRQNKKNLSEEEIITDKLFNKYNTLIQKSLLFKNLVPNLDYVKDVRCIRCLALGSFIEEIQPLYQLSLLIEIVNHLIELNCKDDDYSLVVSLYDPAFTPKDISYINNELNNKKANITWVYEDEKNWENKESDKNVLYYIPHGDLHLLNYLLPLLKPRFYLGNYIFDHLARVKADNDMAYLNNIKLKHCKNIKNSDSDDFEHIKQHKKKQEPIENIPVEFVDLYFNDIKVYTNFHESIEQGPWLSSFSSLALHEFI